MRGFASDNCSGIHPAALAAIADANVGHAPSYGLDRWTAELGDRVRDQFGDDAAAYPVLTGTGANVIALQAMCHRWGAVVTAASAHVAYDECGAPEKLGGLKLYAIDAVPLGKLTPELLAREARGYDDVHRARPEVLALTQATELGTVYTPAELRALCDDAHERGMSVFLDGARLANAAASLGAPLRSLSTDVGVDVLTFGGTKNGLLAGELVIVLNPDAAAGVDYIRKFSAQLVSKMRFVSAQFLALFTDDLWLHNARRSNAAAVAIAAAIESLPGLAVCHPVQANAVFVTMSAAAVTELGRRVPVTVWEPAGTTVRLMSGFDTTEDDVRALVGEIRHAIRHANQQGIVEEKA